MTSAYIMQGVKQHKVLHDVSLELTYKCNLDCFFCYNDRDKVGTVLSLAEYQALLKDLAEMQTMHLMLTGGEPMVHPHFFAIGQTAKDLGFVTRIRTNGHSLSKANALRLKNEVDPFFVEVSFHGATAATHDKQTRIAGSFDRLVNNIQNCQDQGLVMKGVSTPTAWNEHEIEALFGMCDRIGIPLRFQGPVSPRDNGDLTPLQITPTLAAWDTVDRLVQQRAAASNDVESDSQPKFQPSKSPNPQMIEVAVDSIGKPAEQSYSTCSVGIAGVDIDPYGNVQACMHLQESAGNLHDSSIKDIWRHSPLFKKARNKALEAGKQFSNGEHRQLGAHIHCLAVEENLKKGGFSSDTAMCEPSDIERVRQSGKISV